MDINIPQPSSATNANPAVQTASVNPGTPQSKPTRASESTSAGLSRADSAKSSTSSLIAVSRAADSRELIQDFFRSHTAFDVLPDSGKVVVLDSRCTLQQAWSALSSNHMIAACIWSQSDLDFVGLFSATDIAEAVYQFSHSQSPKNLSSQSSVATSNIEANMAGLTFDPQGTNFLPGDLGERVDTGKSATSDFEGGFFPGEEDLRSDCSQASASSSRSSTAGQQDTEQLMSNQTDDPLEGGTSTADRTLRTEGNEEKSRNKELLVDQMNSMQIGNWLKKYKRSAAAVGAEVCSDETLWDVCIALRRRRTRYSAVVERAEGRSVQALQVVTYTTMLRFLLFEFIEEINVISDCLGDLQIGTFKPRVVSVQNTDTIAQALSLMRKHQVSSVPVLDNDGRVLDIFCETDLIDNSLMSPRNGIDPHSSVEDLLAGRPQVRKQLHTCYLSDPMSLVLKKFGSTKSHRLVCIDSDGGLLGIVSLTDVFTFFIIGKASSLA